MEDKSYKTQQKSVGIAFIWNYHILLTKHPRYGDDLSHTLGIPKGRQEPKEKGLDFITAHREVKEEIGIDIPLNWIMDAPKYELSTSYGTTIYYYIVDIDKLSHLGLDNIIVPPNQYQEEEVDFASFIPFSEASKYMLTDQVDILEKVGYIPVKKGEIVNVINWLVKAIDKEGKTYIVILKDDLSENGNNKIYKHFINNGIEIVNSESIKINNTTGNSSVQDAFLSFFENQTGEEVDYQGTMISYDKSTNEVKDVIIETLSGRNYDYDKDTMQFKLREKGFNDSYSDGGDTQIEYQFRDKNGVVKYYKRNGQDIWESISKDEFDKYVNKNNIVFVKNFNDELKKGLEVEKEHENTIKKIKDENLSIKEGEELIAKDHLKERSDYYDVLEEDNLESGGIIEGQLHSECNNPDGCGEKFKVGDSGKVIEAERDEAVIVSKAFNGNIHCPDGTCEYKIIGTPSQIASAINVLGGGKNFDDGAKVYDEDNNSIKTVESKPQAKDTDVEKELESGTIIINRKSMYDKTKYEVKGTARQIASEINSLKGNGKVIEDGGDIKKA